MSMHTHVNNRALHGVPFALSLVLLVQCSSLNLDITDLARLSGQTAPRIFMAWPPQH